VKWFVNESFSSENEGTPSEPKKCVDDGRFASEAIAKWPDGAQSDKNSYKSDRILRAS
jgi:hypothetical protein